MLTGLFAKPFAPRVPLIVLALAGAAPDAAFFLMQFFGLETFNFDSSLVKRGCFPYSNDYPYSHSLVGMAGVGAWDLPFDLYVPCLCLIEVVR